MEVETALLTEQSCLRARNNGISLYRQLERLNEIIISSPKQFILFVGADILVLLMNNVELTVSNRMAVTAFSTTTILLIANTR